MDRRNQELLLKFPKLHQWCGLYSQARKVLLLTRVSRAVRHVLQIRVQCKQMTDAGVGLPQLQYLLLNLGNTQYLRLLGGRILFKLVFIALLN